jgi:ACS family sodium-dependent inorganic phosphate cotransporter
MLAQWHKRHSMMSLLLAALLLCYIDRVIISIAAIEMQKDLGWSDSDKGLVLSSFFMGYLVMQILGGLLANRFGGRNVFLWAVLLWSLFTVLTPMAALAAFPLLIVTRFMLGVGEGASFPSAYNLIQGWMPQTERSRSISFIYAATAVGSIFALAVTGAIIAAYGWASVFYMFGSLGIIWAVFWVTLVPSQAMSPDPVDEQRQEKGPLPWRLLLTHPACLTLYTIGLAAGCISYTMTSWLPSYYVDTFAVDTARAGLLSIVPFGAMIVSSVLAGVYADKRLQRGVAVLQVRREVTLSCGLALIIGLVVLSNSPFLWLGVASATLVMSSMAAMVAGYSPLAGDILPDHGDVLFGFVAGLASVGSALMISLTGFVVQYTGEYSSIFYLMAGLCFIGLLVFMRYAQASPIDL